MSDSEGKILKANTIGPGQIKIGMDVTGIDGERIGKVKEVRDTEFLIDRPMAHDLWVPFQSVMAAEGHGDGFRAAVPNPTDVVLSISAAHVEAQGWRHA
jgi:hypothetical protein